MLAWGLEGWENWGVMAKGCSISFCGNENVLKLWWMHNSRNILQATEYTLLSDWTVCYINYISTNLIIKKFNGAGLVERQTTKQSYGIGFKGQAKFCLCPRQKY